MEAAAVGVAEKPRGRDGKGLRQTSSPIAEPSGVVSVGQRLHVEAEAAALDHPAVNRQVGLPKHEAADDVGAAGDRLQAAPGRPPRRTQSYCQSRRTEPVESTDANAGGRCSRSRRVAAVLAQLQVGGAGAEDGDLLLGDDLPEGSGPSSGPSKTTICAPQASAESCQFHIIQAAVVWKKSLSSGRRSHVQAVLLEVLEQRSAGAVHDALRRRRWCPR